MRLFALIADFLRRWRQPVCPQQPQLVFQTSVSADTELARPPAPAVVVPDEAADDRDDSVEFEASRPRLRMGEVVRKLLHMTPGLFPFLMHSMPHEDPLDDASIRFLIILTVVLTSVFLACYRIVRRPGESNLLVTCLAYPATFLTTLFLFPAHIEFACVVIAVLAIGDGAAYIFGRSFGKTPLPWNPQKTWFGTLAFVACAAPIAALAYWIEARPEVSPFLAIACGGAAAIAGAIAESVPMKITDNLRVGVAAAVAVVAMHFAIA